MNYIPNDMCSLDLVLCDYIEQIWQEGDPKGWAQNAVSGLGHFMPGLRLQLHGSRRLLQSWNKAEVCNRAPPLPANFAVALAGAAIESGNLRLAVVLLVAFHAFLRTGEALQLRASSFVFPDDPGPVLLTLEATKSAKRRGVRAESVVLSDPMLLSYLRVLIPRLEPGECLFAGSGQEFRSIFMQLCSNASLPSLPWRPYSLRRGGATAHFLQFGCFHKTAARGRWESIKTARLYVDEAVALLATIAATRKQQARIQDLVALVSCPTQRKFRR